jgi:hypothetical protein
MIDYGDDRNEKTSFHGDRPSAGRFRLWLLAAGCACQPRKQHCYSGAKRNRPIEQRHTGVWPRRLAWRRRLAWPRLGLAWPRLGLGRRTLLGLGTWILGTLLQLALWPLGLPACLLVAFEGKPGATPSFIGTSIQGPPLSGPFVSKKRLLVLPRLRQQKSPK